MSVQDRWTTAGDDDLREALGSLLDDVTVAPLAEAGFVRSRGAERRRRRALAWTAAAAAAAVTVAVVGFGALGRQDDRVEPVPAQTTTAPAPSPTGSALPTAGAAPIVVGPVGSTPDPSLFIPVPAWAATGLAGGASVVSDTGDPEGASDVVACDADPRLFRGVTDQPTGTFGIAQVRIAGSTFFGRQRVREVGTPTSTAGVDAQAAAAEQGAQVAAYVEQLRTAFAAGCSFGNGVVTGEAGPSEGTYWLVTTFADGSALLTDYVGVAPLTTPGYATTVVLHSLDGVSDADAFVALDRLLEVARQR